MRNGSGKVSTALAREIAARGATFEIADDGMINVDLPRNRTWRANGLHTILCHDAADVRERMAYGIADGPCDDACEVCAL